MQRILIYLGLIIIVAGLGWPWISRIPFGRLPGDFIIMKENFSIYFPLMSMFLLSILISLLLWLIQRFKS